MAEGGAEEAGSHARCSFDEVLCPDNLVAYGPRHAEGVQPIVELAVHAEGVAAGMNLPYDAAPSALAATSTARAIRIDRIVSSLRMERGDR